MQSPVIQDDTHLWAVLRSIEANPLRAGVVAELADHPWSSDPAHALGRPDPLLAPLPEWADLAGDESERRARWRAKVSAALADDQLAAIRGSLRSGRPFGESGWVEATTRRLRPTWERRPRGRPRKTEK